MDDDLRLAYSVQTNQVRVSFQLNSVLSEKRPPKDIFRRAKAKLQDEVSKGQIEAYAYYDEDFQAFWDHLRELLEKAPERQAETVTFVLAQGFRQPKGYVLRQEGKNWLLTLPLSGTPLAKFAWQRLLAWASQQVGAGLMRDPWVRSRILEAYCRACNQENIKDFALLSGVMQGDERGTRLHYDKTGKRVLLCLESGIPLRDVNDLRTLMQKVSGYLQRHQEKLGSYQAIKKELQDFLKDLLGGPESFGFGLPLYLPVAYQALVSESPAAAPPEPAPKPPSVAKAPEKSPQRSAHTLIEIKIAADGMEAVISWSNDEKLATGRYDTDKAWLEKAVADHGISRGFETELDNILTCLTLGQSIKGQVIARGLMPQPGDKAYLYPSYLHKTLTEAEMEADIDIRSAQNKLVVEVGDLICELRYLDGKTGFDVRGKVRRAPVTTKAHRIEVGNGVERRDDGAFYSLIRGIPRLERSRVSCLEVYVHHGDVNLKSGDIHFDGAVEIRGNIDNGARVYAKSDLIVGGSIGHSKVRCGGDLKVLKGIVTSQEGIVYAGGGVHAQFIENSRLQAELRIEVERSILNSHIKCGGEIVCKNLRGGKIAGGTVMTQGSLQTPILGFPDGEKTFVRIGTNWRIEYRIELLKARLIRIRNYQELKQNELEELRRRPKQDERTTELEKRLKKTLKLGDKIEKLIETLRGKIRWSDEAVLLVLGTLESNVDITVGGRGVVIDKAMKEVMVSGLRFRNQFINPLHLLNQYRKMLSDKAS